VRRRALCPLPLTPTRQKPQQQRCASIQVVTETDSTAKANALLHEAFPWRATVEMGGMSSFVSVRYFTEEAMRATTC